MNTNANFKAKNLGECLNVRGRRRAELAEATAEAFITKENGFLSNPIAAMEIIFKLADTPEEVALLVMHYTMMLASETEMLKDITDGFIPKNTAVLNKTGENIRSVFMISHEEFKRIIRPLYEIEGKNLGEMFEVAISEAKTMNEAILCSYVLGQLLARIEYDQNGKL